MLSLWTSCSFYSCPSASAERRMSPFLLSGGPKGRQGDQSKVDKTGYPCMSASLHILHKSMRKPRLHICLMESRCDLGQPDGRATPASRSPHCMGTHLGKLGIHSAAIALTQSAEGSIPYLCAVDLASQDRCQQFFKEQTFLLS